MEEVYRVSLVAFPDIERSEAVRRLSYAFGVPEEMSAYFIDHMPVGVKENAQFDEAAEYVDTLVELGAIATLENPATGRTERYSGAAIAVDLNTDEAEYDTPQVALEVDPPSRLREQRPEPPNGTQKQSTTPSVDGPLSERASSQISTQTSTIDRSRSGGFEKWATRQASQKHTKRERQTLILAGLGLFVFIVALVALTKGTDPPRVYFVNALGIPVQVQFGDVTVFLEPHTFFLQDGIEDGRHLVTASTLSGDLISTETVQIPDNEVVAAYNVLGAADIYTENIHYTTLTPGEHNTYQLFIGQTFAYQSDVVFAFEEPPAVMENPGFRRYFGFLEPNDWGWRASLEILLEDGYFAEAHNLAANIDRYDERAGAQAYLEDILSQPQPPEDYYRY